MVVPCVKSSTDFFFFSIGTWANDRENKRVQVFGYNYLDPTKEPKPIPECYQSLLDKISASGFGDYDQLIVSEFRSGVGLKSHVDRLFWDGSIIGISLMNPCIMELARVDLSRGEKFRFNLMPGSLYQLKGQARYAYAHGIPADSIQGTRISLTFRNLATEQVVLPQGVVDVLRI